ncbi:MAG TPA: hypothetical protein VK507_02970 [Iamia sp.]|nr:hypothetical protein [Iamia sp.]
MARWRRSVGLVAALTALVAGAGCGGEGGEQAQDPTTAPDERSAASSPFTVGTVPDGFVARSAGMGTQEPVWGEDSFGTDQPYLVLSPDGTPEHPDVVVVALTGYQGYQGGLDQASGSYGPTEEVEVGGDEGRFAPAIGAEDPEVVDGETRWADLVVAQGDADLAIRVTSPEATFDELAAIVDHVVVPEDRTQPPAMPDPPAGLEVVGAVGAHAVIADQSYVDQQSEGGPGPTTAHGVGWLRGGTEDGEHLVVLTLPARSADLAALAVGLAWEHHRRGDPITVSGEGDVVRAEQIYSAEDGGGAERSVWTIGPDGDLVVASAHGVDPPSLDELAALARTAEPTAQETWDAFVADVRGGPGLHADPGRAELMRGPVGDGREWLLQDQPPGEGNMMASSDDPGWSVDPCLLLSDDTRECVASEGASLDTWTAAGRGDTTGVHFVVVATRRPDAAALRVDTDGVVAVVPLVPVGATGEAAAAVVGEGYQLDLCSVEAPATGTRIIQLVDAAGASLTCPP